MITEYLWSFEYRAAKVPPAILMAAAIVMLVLGLFVWFGGFGYKKILYIIMGAFCGAACTISIASANYLLALALVGGGAMLSFKLQETFLSFVIAVIVAIYGYSVLISPYFKATREVVDVLRQIAIGVPYYNWPILLGVVLMPFAITASWFAGASAGYSSLTASIMFMASAIMILKRFGYGAAAMISSNVEIVMGILAVITGIGMVVQLLIMPRISDRFAAAKEAAKTKAKKPKKIKKEDSESGADRITAWRTS
jgi:hypothetical protein